jgi:hypothetical protein
MISRGGPRPCHQRNDASSKKFRVKSAEAPIKLLSRVLKLASSRSVSITSQSMGIANSSETKKRSGEQR